MCEWPQAEAFCHFKKKPLPALEKMFPSLVIAYSDNGWIDNTLTIEYINKVPILKKMS
jgi:hypothetical protein